MQDDPLSILTGVLFNAAVYTLIGIVTDRRLQLGPFRLAMGIESTTITFSGPRKAYAYACGLRIERKESEG